MSDAGAEDNCAFFADIFHISIHYQRVAFRNVYFAFKVADIVLHTVETYLSEVDVGMYSYTSHGDKFSDFNSGLDIQLVGSIAKISSMSLSSARSGVAVSPRVNSGLKYERTF